MQWAISSQTAFSRVHSQATRVPPRRATGVEDKAVNDAGSHRENSLWRMMVCVLANVIGGAVLLTGMYALPHILAKILS